MDDEERDLIPKLPGQTTDDINVPTRQVFEYIYKNFTDSNSHKYLEDVQPWLHFRRHNRKDHSIPVLDYTGKEFPDLVNWTLQDIDSLLANAQKLRKYNNARKINMLNPVYSTAIDTIRYIHISTNNNRSNHNPSQYHKHWQQ